VVDRKFKIVFLAMPDKRHSVKQHGSVEEDPRTGLEPCALMIGRMLGYYSIAPRPGNGIWLRCGLYGFSGLARKLHINGTE
jgi:hypothetical protein